MLLNTHHTGGDRPAAVDSVHNYYEHLVLEAILRMSPRANDDMDFLADAACVALNHLPPRYVRHDVDMAFYLSPQEMNEIEAKVDRAVTEALAKVEKNQQWHPSEAP